MIIIIEGPDGAGKTTTINKLLKSHPGSTTVHFSNPLTDEEAFGYWKVYAKAILDSDPNGVTFFDRSWYSDMVYAPIFREREEMSQLHCERLNSLLVHHGGGHIVYCTASPSRLWKRCKKRGEDYVKTKALLDQVSIAYENIMYTQDTLPVIRFDTTNY
jgi:thymidylate kinase